MRTLLSSLALGLLLLATVGATAYGQIFGPEGLNLPGQLRGWTNPPDKASMAGIQGISGSGSGGLFLLDNGLATPRYTTTIYIAATGGDTSAGTYDWLFTSGPSSNYYANKWASVTVSFNTIQTYTKEGGTNNSVTVANDRWYQVNFKDQGYVNTDAIWMELTGAPVNITAVSAPASGKVPAASGYTVNATLSAAPSADQKFFVRYSTDSWATSSYLTATVVGTTASAVIPAQTAGTTVAYYVFSSVVTDPSTNPDMYSIRYNNNGGSNYSYVSTAPLSGIYTIPGSYATVKLAVDDINLLGVAAPGATFNVSAGHTETAPGGSGILITDSTATALAPILFQKVGLGPNPLITAGPGVSTTVDGIITFAGCDYITFDGFDLLENPLNTTATLQMEWGFGLLSANPGNGAQHNEIRNCVIALNKTNTASTGIYQNIHTPASTTLPGSIPSVAGTASYNKYNGNQITNVYFGIKCLGLSTFYNVNNEIGFTAGNTFTNWGGGSVSAFAINANCEDNLKIYNNNVSGGTATTTLRGLYVGTLSAGANMDIVNNVLSGLSSSATSSSFVGIELNSSLGTVNVRKNTITGFTYPTTSSGTLRGIYYNASGATVLNIDSNTVSNNTLSSGAGTGAFEAITVNNLATGTPLNIRGNLVIGNRKAGASGSIYGSRIGTANVVWAGNQILDNGSTVSNTSIFYGYYNIGSPTNEDYYNNTIRGLFSAGTSTMYGIYTNTTTSIKNYYNNLIDSLYTGGSTVNGIYQAAATTASIYNNTIRNLRSTNTGASVYGVNVVSGTTIYVYNNYVSDLMATAATGTVSAVAGLYLGGGTNVGAYYNTVYLNATSSSTTTFGTSGIYASTTPIVDLRNNVVVDLSTPGPTGGTVAAYRRSGTNLGTYWSASNNNDFYVNPTLGVRRYYFADGTNFDSTFAAFKGRVTPRDGSSFAELPPFVNVATKPYDLHMQTAIATQTESGGSPVTTPAITTDFDGELRNGTTPDVGADEFIGTGLDLVGPAITYTALGNTHLTTDRSLAVAIADPSGVQRSLLGQPRIYYKKGAAGTYVAPGDSAVEGPTGTFTFTLRSSYLGPLNIGDTVYYYVAAQDSLNNAGTSPAGSGATYDPPNATVASPNFYRIVPSIPGGTYTIGATPGPEMTPPGVFLTVKAFFDSINASVVTGAIVGELISNTTETATAVLNAVAYDAGGPYTITLKPAAATVDTIGGNIAGAIIRLNGADNVIIDGSNSGGTDRSLTVANANTSTNTAAIWLSSVGTGQGSANVTVKNCVIQAGSKTVSPTFGLYVGGSSISSTGTGDDNDNLTVQNNVFKLANYGLYARAASTGKNNGMVVTQNEFGQSDTSVTLGKYGLDIAQADGASITRNEIGYFVGTITNPTGMLLGTGFTNATIARNKIHDLRYTGTGGYGGKGIDLNSGVAASGITIANNLIYNLLGDGWSTLTSDAIVGLRVQGTTGGLNIYHNSVHLVGNADRAASSTLSAALYIPSGVANIDLRNNILSNGIVNNLNAGAKAYSIYDAGTNAVFSTINNNDYLPSGTQGVLGYLGADQTTLLAWQTATTQDAASISADPLFLGPNDLRVALGSPVLAAGATGTGVTDDYAGALRGSPPSIGAYESGTLTGPPNCAILVSPADAAPSVPLTATLNWANGGNGTTGYRIYFGTNTPPTDSLNGVDLGNVTTYDPPFLSYSTTYYWQIVAYNGNGPAVGCPIWSFTTEPDPTVTTFPYAEGFESTTFPPAGWTSAILSGSYNWERVTAGTNPTQTPYSGVAEAMFRSYSATAGSHARLVSPPMVVPVAGLQVLFQMYKDPGYSTNFDSVAVEVTTDGGANWTSLASFQRYGAVAQWQQHLVPLTGYSGTIKVGFHAWSRYGNNMFIDSVIVREVPALPPDCAGLVSPADSATAVALTATLNWSAPTGGGPVTGYKLYFGTDTPPSDSVNGTNLGNVLTYDPPYLQYSTTYYWKIVPTGTSGDATGCPIWSFTTGPDPAVTLPWAESFDLVTPPALPYGWSQENTNGDGVVWGSYATTSARSLPNVASISYNSSLAMNDWMFSPPVNLTGGSNYNFKFWYRTASLTYPESLEVYLGTSPTSAGMVTEIVDLGEISTLTWTEVSAVITPITSGTYYIGWHGYSALDMFRILIDDVSLAEQISIDIGIADFAGTALRPAPMGWIDYARKGTAELPATSKTAKEDAVDPEIKLNATFDGFTLTGNPKFEVIVFNNGSASVPTYQVGWLIDGTPQTAVNNTDALDVADADTLVIEWTSPTAGPHSFQAYTILAGDGNTANDSSAVLAFEVYGPEVVFNQGFNSYTFPPAGWTVVNADGGTDPNVPSWFRDWGYGEPEGTAYAAQSYLGANSLGVIDDWMISPNTGAVVPPATVDTLSFWVRHAGATTTYPDSLMILVSLTTADLDSFTTIIDYIQVPGDGIWNRLAYALPEGANRYVAFRTYLTDALTYGNYYGLDDVRITRHSFAVPEPIFSVVPAALSFGGVNVGDSLSLSAKVYNTGTANLDLTSITSDNAVFEVNPASGTVLPGDSLLIDVEFEPLVVGGVGGNLVFVHNAMTSPDTVVLSGTGLAVGPSPKFLTLEPEEVFDENPLKPGKSNKAVKRAKPGKPIDPLKNVPNRTNILSEAVAQGAFAPGTTESDSAGGMVIGVSHMYLKDPIKNKWAVIKDSAAIRCWMRMSKWDFKKNIGKNHADFQKTLYDKVLLFHDGTPSGLDFTTDGKNKPLLKQLKKLTPKKHDNALLAELVALKVNIGASQLGTTPVGFGDLIYDNDGNTYDEQSILAISATADQMMTYWQAYTPADFQELYDVVYDLNRAFPGSLPLDTVQFNAYAGEIALPLIVNGEVELSSVSYLKAPVPFVATTTPRLNNEVEAPEEFDDEEWEEGEGVPVAAKLYQNYPNPFNPGTTLSFRLLEDSRVTIRIYNTLGQQIAELITGEEMEEGYNEVRFDAGLLSSGVYFYQIDVQGVGDEGMRSVLTNKMLLLK